MGEVDNAVLSDTNSAVMACHEAVRNNVEAVIDLLQDGSRHPVLEGWKERYNTLRAEYNEMTPGGALFAARFIWLNRACFNGLYRVNKSGLFNVPVGSYQQVKLPLPSILRSASSALQCAVLHTMSFERAFPMIPWKKKGHDQVYCDPPYVPRSNSSSFTAYTKGGFPWKQHELLAACARQAADRGVRVVLSNNDLEAVRELYKGFSLTKLTAKRSISATKKGRGSVGELLIVAGPVPVASTPMMRRVEQALMAMDLEDPEVNLETSSDRVGGVIISESFAKMDPVARQDLIWDHLKERFPEDQHRIAVLITLTPAEVAE